MRHFLSGSTNISEDRSKKSVLLGVILIIPFIAIAMGALALYRHYNTFSMILTDTLCNPPCWQNIQPGKTKTWEAVSIVESMQYVGRITQWEESYGYKINWSFSYPVRESSGYIYFSDNTVIAISLLTYKSLSVVEALEFFGEPDTSFMRHKETPERQWLEIVLIYPVQGIFVRVDIELAEETNGDFITYLDWNASVGRVIYFDPTQYEHLLSSRILFREDEQTILERQQAWQGLGLIDYSELVTD